MKKIVINTDWGGFGLSREAQDHKRKGGYEVTYEVVE